MTDGGGLQPITELQSTYATTNKLLINYAELEFFPETKKIRVNAVR